MITVVRAFLLPRCDVGREGGLSSGFGWCNRERPRIAVSVLIQSAVRWRWSEEWEVGSCVGEVWYLSTRHDWCVPDRGGFDCLTWISSPDN